MLPIDRREYLKFAGTALTPIAASKRSKARGHDAGRSDRRVPAPTSLRVEYMDDPLGIETQTPRLSWQFSPERRGQTQSAYRVLVASSERALREDRGDKWDSGKVRMKPGPTITYDGERLESDEQVYWKVKVWDDQNHESAWSDTARWGAGLRNANDWDAKWIRRTTDDNQFSYVRKDIELDKSVAEARAYISAGHHYKLWINGRLLDKGLAFSFPDHKYYKAVDISETFRQGRNAVGFLHNWNGGSQGRPEGAPGLICQIVLEFEDGESRTITTDSSWRVRDAPWLTARERLGEVGEPVERIDGREYPEGWNRPGFDDSSWEEPTVLGTPPTAPWDQLTAQRREITREVVEPVSLTRLESGEYIADFGRVIAAMPRVRFEEGISGQHISMRTGYIRDETGRVSKLGTQLTDMEYEYIQRDGEQLFRPFLYLGFRYFQIDPQGEELDEDQIFALARYNNVPDERAADFSSSVPMLDDVWELARHSALHGSQEQFVDTPTREKGQFLGDTYNISLSAMEAFGERNLSRGALQEFMRSQERFWAEEGRLNAVYPLAGGKRDIPDYTEKYPEWLWQYYRRSGDGRLLEEAYPVVKNIAEYVERYIDSKTGLIVNLAGGGDSTSSYQYGIVDFPTDMRYGYDMDTKARTTVNVLGMNVFRRTAQIAEELGRPDDEVADYRERADSLRTAINEWLTRPDGVYTDGLKSDDSARGRTSDSEVRSQHASQHANAYALAFDVVPAENEQTVADYISDQQYRAWSDSPGSSPPMAMGPMTVQWLLRALDTADRTSEMVDLITDAGQDGWAEIIQEDGTFTWESWKARNYRVEDGSALEADQSQEPPYLSMSHPWGAIVLPVIQEILLGVQVFEAGARSEIAPAVSELASASGRVPTERGAIEVEWNKTPGGLVLSVAITGDATSTVRVPDLGSDAVRLRERNRVIWDDNESNGGGASSDLPSGVQSVRRTTDAVVVDVGGGSYDFELSRETTGTGVPLQISGSRSDDARVFTGGQTNRIDLSVEASEEVTVRDQLPDGWSVVGGDPHEVYEIDGTRYIEFEQTGETVEVTYFAEAPSEPQQTGRYTFGPIEATAGDEWLSISSTTDTNTVVGPDTNV